MLGRAQTQNTNPPNDRIGQSAASFHRRHAWRRIAQRIGLIVLGVTLFAATFLAYKAWAALHHVVVEHVGPTTTALQNNAPDPELATLKGEGESRVNILLLGVGDASHAGSGLSDTMMVASIDTKTKSVATIGIPRDLYVPIPGYGYDKINAAHAYGGPELAKQVVGSVLDVPIHYYARLDFTGFKKIVTTLGGVQVQVAENLYDNEYPCDKDERVACGFSLKAGNQLLNGDVALKYVRCRKGNCGNDYGRSARQGQILVALREKALTASTLTNPLKLAALMDVVGRHAQADLQTGEIQNLAAILQEVESSNIQTKVIDTDTTQLVYATNINGASVVVPNAGSGKFAEIQSFVHKLFADRYILSERARVKIIDASGKKQGEVLKKVLESYNYQVGGVETTTTQVDAVVTLVDATEGKKPFTLRYLENRLKTTAQKNSATQSDADIIIEIGGSYGATNAAGR